MGAGENSGCTLCCVRRPGNVAKVVGIGYRVGAQTCKALRVEGKWIVAGGTLSLDKQEPATPEARMGETRRPARNPKQGMTAQAVRSRPRAPKKHPAAAGRKPRIGPGGRGRA